VDLGGTREEFDRLVAEAEKANNGPAEGAPLLRSLAEVHPEEIDWLSRGRIPRGKITVLEGHPGQGKSMVAYDLAARVTRGQSFPGDPPIEPGVVLVLTAEDGLGDTVVPRIIEAGGDRSRVYALEGRIKAGRGDQIVLPDDIHAVETAVRDKAVVLVIVDVLNAYLSGGVDSHKDHDIRRALYPIKLMAESTGAAVLIIRHLRKNSGGQSVTAGAGSIGIGGGARSVLLVDKDPSDPDECRILASVKCNIAERPPSLKYRIVKGASGAPRIDWLGESGETADSLTEARAAREAAGNDRTKADELGDLLTEWLIGGEMDRREVLNLAKQAGFSESTRDRALVKLGVIKRQRGFGRERRSFFSLPVNSIPVNPPKADETDGNGPADGIGDFRESQHSPEDALFLKRPGTGQVKAHL
jgi:hypothetical protein